MLQTKEEKKRIEEGFHKQFLEELKPIVMKWIAINLKSIKTVNFDLSSYRLKHICEVHLPSGYIRVNDFEEAMIESGYKPYYTINSPNPYYRISKKSLRQDDSGWYYSIGTDGIERIQHS